MTLPTEKVRIEYVDIDSLRLWNDNPRLNDPAVPAVMESIKKYGFLGPVVAGKDRVIKAGNTRYKAAKKLGLKQIPVVWAEHLTEKELTAFALADNKTAEIAQWDLSQLSRLVDLAEIKGIPGFDKKDVDRINALLLQEKGLEPQKPETLEPPSNPTVKPGEVWRLGEHFLACGNSTDPPTVFGVLKDFRPALMVTDPPYGVGYDANWRNKATREDGTPIGAKAVAPVHNDGQVDWTEAWRLFEGEVAYVWHAGRHASKVQNSLERVGFEIKAQIVWVKQNFVLSRGHYHWKHEPCWYAVRQGKTGAWNGDRKQTTVWEIDNFNAFGTTEQEDMRTAHSTQKPIEAMARPILNNSQMGEYVYDPFLGSGTTLIAAEKLERRCLGVEIDPAYCQMAIDRWEAFTGKKAKRA